MKDLVLYYSQHCPYCQKVLRFLQRKPIKLELKEINQEANAKEELRKIGGKIQVPCLDIEGKALYESDDIIQWLAKIDE